MRTFKRPFNDTVDPEVFHAYIESQLGFTVNTKLPVDATTYELLGRSLRHHCYLLAPIRPTEAVTHETLADYKFRIMGLLWYGKKYHHGLVVEVFGRSIEPHMNGIVTRFQQDFDHEVQMVTRIFKTPRFK